MTLAVQRGDRTPPPFAFCCMLLIAAAFALAINSAASRPLWLDEIFSGAVAISPSNGIFDRWLAADVHPPLYYLLLHLWTSVAGTSDLVLRLPSLALYGATVVVGGWAVARRQGGETGWIAAVALAVPATAIWYAGEARSYALQMLLALLLCLAIEQLRQRWDRLSWAATITLSALLGLTHYVALLFAAMMWLVLLPSAWRQRRVLHVLAAGLVVALLLLPWLAWHLPYMLTKTGGNFWIPPTGFGASLYHLSLAAWSDIWYFLFFAVIPLGLLIATKGAASFARVSERVGGYVLVTAGAIVSLAILSLYSPMVVARYMVPFVPVTALIATGLLATLSPGLRRVSAVGAAAGAMILGILAPSIGPNAWLAWERQSDWVAGTGAEQMIFAFDDPAGRHIGTANLADVAAFFLRRDGNAMPVVARTPLPSLPVMDDRLPEGGQVAVISVGTRLDRQRLDPSWLERIKARYPDWRCMPAEASGPQACLFDTR